MTDRYRRLIAAGFHPVQARALADSGFDVVYIPAERLLGLEPPS